MVELDPDIRSYYEAGRERFRLEGGLPSGPLEFARTKELISRHLPDDEMAILDVGGGPGRYAAWLAGLGHQLTLIDPIERHIEQARQLPADITASVGDARKLAADNASAEVVLLLGPLYHLVDAADRLQALREARRVLAPGGLLVAAAIARFAALLDLLVRVDRMHETAVFETALESVRTGVFHGGGDTPFTTAYLHLPDELVGEIEQAGFEPPTVYNVEGPGFLVHDLDERWQDPARRRALLETARGVEAKRELQAAASHLLAVAHRPQDE